MMPRLPLQLPRRATITPRVDNGGIFRDVDALEGTDVFNVYGSDGRRLGRWEASEDVTDKELLEAFGELLERRRLRVTPLSRPRPAS
jgi:hypothetical protein